MYKVDHYQSAYEPYVITSKHVSWSVPFHFSRVYPNILTPLDNRCDERFAGYGANKAACLFEMYLSGVSYYVLSDHFLIHQSHKYEEQARKEEVRVFVTQIRQFPHIIQRKSNRKLYADFKEESCLRYVVVSSFTYRAVCILRSKVPLPLLSRRNVAH